MSLGLAMLFSLIANNWKLIKIVLVVGLLAKAMFAWALLFTLFASIASLGVTGIWFALMFWQVLCIAYFTPEVKNAPLR